MNAIYAFRAHLLRSISELFVETLPHIYFIYLFIQVLFPLFMQLDCPIKSAKILQDAHLDILQTVAYKPPQQDLQSLAQILEFSANLLAKSPDLQNDMIDFDGFSILGLMFQWFSPVNWVFIYWMLRKMN